MTTEDATADRTPWHLDRKVPMAIIITLAIQAGTFVWWASQIENRTHSLELADDKTTVRVEKLEDLNPEMLQRLTVVETQITNQTKILDQILQELRKP